MVLVPLGLVQRHVDALPLPGSARRRGEGGEGGGMAAGALPFPLLLMPEKKPMLAMARAVAGVGAGVARLGRGQVAVGEDGPAARPA